MRSYSLNTNKQGILVTHEYIPVSYNALYYLGLCVYVLSINLQYSYFYNIWTLTNSSMLLVLQLMRYTAYFLCMLQLLFFSNKIDGKIILLIILFFVSAVYASVTGPQKAPIFCFLIIIASTQTDFRKCVSLFLIIQAATFIFFVASSVLVPEFSAVVYEGGRERLYLGYGWVNRASYCWLFICLELLYIKKARFSFIDAAILTAVNMFIYLKTDTSFSMLLTLAVIGCGLFIYCIDNTEISAKVNFDSRTVNTIAIALFLISVLSIFAFTYVYKENNSTMSMLNAFSHGRLSLGKAAIEKYGIHLGGNPIQWVGASTILLSGNSTAEYFYVDSGFLQLALEYGLLYTGVVGLIYIAAIEKACRTRDWSAVIVMLFLSILFFFEPYVIDFGFNPFVLYCFTRDNIVDLHSYYAKGKSLNEVA